MLIAIAKKANYQRLEMLPDGMSALTKKKMPSKKRGALLDQSVTAKGLQRLMLFTRRSEESHLG